jgi:hypothetical protein
MAKQLELLITAQFRANTANLVAYNPAYQEGMPQVVFLRSCEGWSGDVRVQHKWVMDRSNPADAKGDWEKLVGGEVKVVDIPGNHFEVFEKKNVSFFYSFPSPRPFRLTYVDRGRIRRYSRCLRFVRRETIDCGFFFFFAYHYYLECALSLDGPFFILAVWSFFFLLQLEFEVLWFLCMYVGKLIFGMLYMGG